MGTIPLHTDFSAFLRLLNAYAVRYLLIGGYAVGYHGFVRATADLDIWVPRERQNSERLVEALRAFGFNVPELKADVFLDEDRIVRMGVPPVQIEIATTISGVDFEECYADRVESDWDDVVVHIISLAQLRENKRASGRLQDLNDLSHLDGVE
jgi:hypothetical protein